MRRRDLELLTPMELMRILGDPWPEDYRSSTHDDDWSVGPITSRRWKRLLQAQVRKVRRLDKAKALRASDSSERL